MLASLVITVPLIYLWGETAIIPSLLFVALAQMLLTIYCSYRQFPLHISFSRPLLGEGVSMVKLGVAFVIAGIFGSGVDFIIRSHLNNASTRIEGGVIPCERQIAGANGSVFIGTLHQGYHHRIRDGTSILIGNRHINHIHIGRTGGFVHKSRRWKVMTVIYDVAQWIDNIEGEL